MKTIAFHTLGCKVNFTETSTLQRKFTDLGFQITDFKSKADIYVIHSCVVTAIAEKKCISSIRQAYQRNSESRIAVIGCMSELQKNTLLNENKDLLILGNAEKFSLDQYLNNTPNVISDKSTFIPSYSKGGRTRTFFKIQDGCDYYCTYCTIPHARGDSRSLSVNDTIEEIEKASLPECKELVLTGINIGHFGSKNGETFLQLLQSLVRLDHIKRIRLSSIEPDLLDEEICSFIASHPVFMPHIHIPLQSGSDKILQAMERKYDTALFAKRIQFIKKLMPHACIATDIITGFPNETQEDFESGLHFIKSLDITYMHVFTYSARPNTKAALLSDMISNAGKKERSRILHELSEEKKNLFYHSHLNTTRDVLFENTNKDGFLYGFTDNYIKVRIPFDESLKNTIQRVTLATDGDLRFLSGKII